MSTKSLRVSSHVVAQLEESMLVKKTLPDFKPGDTVVVQVRVKEGDRERLQPFEGVVLAIRGRGYHSAFTVRKISHGEGAERVFPFYGPVVESVAIKRRGVVRRAKLYFLRDLSGRAARIKEKQLRKQDILKDIVGDAHPDQQTDTQEAV